METNIVELSLDQLDQIFKDNPSPLPTADDLSVGKENQVTDSSEPANQDDNSDNKDIPTPPAQEPEGITEIDVNDIPSINNEGSDSDDTSDSAPDPVNPEPIGNTNDVLKNTVNFLVEQGYWADFDGRDELDITPEVWADLAFKQAQYSASQMFNEMLDETGEYGKAIISYIKEGGDPNEIIDLFKEQKSIENIDTSTLEGKQAKIETYYSEILKWKPERIAKHLDRIISDDELDEEFAMIEEAYTAYYSEKLQEKQRKQEEEQRKRIESQKQFVSKIKEVLDSDPSLTNKEKTIIASSILDFKHKLPNGQKVNEFYLQFAEKQNDPKEYIDLVRFVMDKEGYLKKYQKQAETKANKEAYNFIKGNSSVSKPRNTPVNISDNKKRGTDFSFFLKK